MAIKKLNPYLNFNGNGLQAIKHYESVLGARIEGLQRFGEMPGDTSTPENKDRVIHALVYIGPGVIMISDTAVGQTVPAGGNAHVCLDYDDAAEMATHFEALGRGGKVTMPLQDTFWGAKFGMLQDAFGINWMFNCTTAKS